MGGLSLPVALPGIVLGVSLVVAFQMFAVSPGVHRVIVGHVTFVLPVVMLIVLSRLRLLDPSYAEASMDLGANRLRTFAHVVFPMISSDGPRSPCSRSTTRRFRRCPSLV